MKLFEVLNSIESEEAFHALFLDLCTPSEIEKMEQRLEAAQLLLGGLTYGAIIEKTGISCTTLSRVSRCIQHGAGGYSEILKKLMPKKARKEERQLSELSADGLKHFESTDDDLKFFKLSKEDLKNLGLLGDE